MHYIGNGSRYDQSYYYSPIQNPIGLVRPVILTAVIWSNVKPDVEFQYGGRSGEFHGTSSHSHLPHCRVLPLGEFTVMIPEPHATLQGAVT